MKILMVTLGVYSRTDGIEMFNRRVVRCLGELTGTTIERSHVIALWDEPHHSRFVPDSVGFSAGLSSKFGTARQFLQETCVMRPDVIIYGHVMLAPLAMAAHKLSPGSKHLLFVHGSEVWNDPKFRRVPYYEIAVVRRYIDGIVPVSDFTKTQMGAAFRLPPQRFRKFLNATDIENPVVATAATTRSGTGPRLLTVSRLGAGDGYKGVDKVIRAMPRILNAFPDAGYEVVGEGPLRRELTWLAERSGVADRVHFRGYLDDVQLQAAYDSADLFLMPSTGEGFGIVFLEAWKHRLPVICGNRDASSEVVTHRQNGLTVDPSNIDEIADAAIELLANRDLAGQLGESGYRTLVSQYSHDHFRSRLQLILTDSGLPD